MYETYFLINKNYNFIFGVSEIKIECKGMFSLSYLWIGARLTESLNMNKTTKTKQKKSNQSKLN